MRSPPAYNDAHYLPGTLPGDAEYILCLPLEQFGATRALKILRLAHSAAIEQTVKSWGSSSSRRNSSTSTRRQRPAALLRVSVSHVLSSQGCTQGLFFGQFQILTVQSWNICTCGSHAFGWALDLAGSNYFCVSSADSAAAPRALRSYLQRSAPLHATSTPLLVC